MQLRSHTRLPQVCGLNMCCEAALGTEGLATAIVVTHVIALSQMHSLNMRCEAALATDVVITHMVALSQMNTRHMLCEAALLTEGLATAIILTCVP